MAIEMEREGRGDAEKETHRDRPMHNAPIFSSLHLAAVAGVFTVIFKIKNSLCKNSVL